jgi:hypothetical protein
MRYVMSAPSPQSSLHRSALTLLKRAQVTPHPEISPLVQLMQWSLTHQKDDQFRHLRKFQGQVLEEMEAWTPEEVEQWLLAPGDRDPQAGDALPLDGLEGLNPQEASQVLLSLLHDQLPLHNRMYPPLSDPRNAVPRE